jgi:uncharacterized DUF497 family protein
MQDDFDPIKDQANVAKHGMSLAFGGHVFKDDNHLILPSSGSSMGRSASRSSVSLTGGVHRRLHLARRSAPFHFRAKEQQE